MVVTVIVSPREAVPVWVHSTTKRRVGTTSISARRDRLRKSLPNGRQLRHDGDALDFDDDAGPGEARDGDEGAGGIAALLEELLADLDEAIAHARIGDEHRHRHHVGERGAGALEGAAEQREHGARLLLELPGDVAAVQVDERRLAGEPDDAPALADDGGGIGAALLRLARRQVLELHEPLMTTSLLSTDFTPSTLPARRAARAFSSPVGTVPKSETVPAAALTSMPAAWSEPDSSA